MGVHVIPMPVILEGKTYYEGVNLTHEEFCHVGHGAFGMGISKRIR